jgi:hypothetical protein
MEEPSRDAAVQALELYRVRAGGAHMARCWRHWGRVGRWHNIREGGGTSGPVERVLEMVDDGGGDLYRWKEKTMIVLACWCSIALLVLRPVTVEHRRSARIGAPPSFVSPMSERLPRSRR